MSDIIRISNTLAAGLVEISPTSKVNCTTLYCTIILYLNILLAFDLLLSCFFSICCTVHHNLPSSLHHSPQFAFHPSLHAMAAQSPRLVAIDISCTLCCRTANHMSDL